MVLSGKAKEQQNAAYLWKLRIEDRGIDAAICDKYPDLFTEDEELYSAHSQYLDAIEKINSRMKVLSITSGKSLKDL
jgi:hypothetical protein